MKKLRVTLAAQIGTLGGTFGLFTGMSLIGMVEIGYWLLRIIVSFMSGLGHHHKEPGREKKRKKHGSQQTLSCKPTPA